MRVLRPSTALMLAISAAAPAIAHGGIAYTIADLGTLSADGLRTTEATGINAGGDVVGWSLTSSGSAHAFLWRGGVMTDLGTLAGGSSRANALNGTDQVVGSSDSLAFLWSGAIMSLGVLPGYFQSFANGINAVGQAVGASCDFDCFFGAAGFLWSDGVMARIGALPGDVDSYAQAINTAGQVAGQSSSTFESYHAFLWEKGAMTPLGTLPGSNYSDTAAINDAGQVAGTARVSWPSPARAFLWQGGTMVDLGTLPGSSYSAAVGMNRSGHVVGEATTKGGYDVGHLHAVLWRDGLMIDLNDAIPPASGWSLFAARGINDAGQIVGWGVIDGAVRGFILTPLSR